MRRGFEELPPKLIRAAICENIFPGDEYVVEYDQRIALIEPRRERVIKAAGLRNGVRPAAINFQPFGIYRNHERKSLFFFLRSHGFDATDKHVIGDRGPRAEHLRAA